MGRFILFCIIELVLSLLAGSLYEHGAVGSCISLSIVCIIAAIIEAAFLICGVIQRNRF